MTNENAPTPISLRTVRVKNAEAGVANVEAYLEKLLYGRRPMSDRSGPLRERVQAYVTLLTEGLDALDTAVAEHKAATEVR